MGRIIIRLPEKEDSEKIVNFLKKETSLEIDSKDFKKNCFDDYHPSLHCMIAEDKSEECVVGCVLWSIGYGTWKGRKMFVECLSISEKFKDSDVERNLFSGLCHNAMKNGYTEITCGAKDQSYLGNVMLKNGADDGTKTKEWEFFSIKI